MAKKTAVLKEKPEVKTKAKRQQSTPKVKKMAEKSPEGPHESKFTPGESPANVNDPVLTVLKDKLRRKFSQLRQEQLNFDTKDALINHVCLVLGMERPQLNSILTDL